MKRRSMQRYRSVDLFLWFVILLVFESIAVIASEHWFPAQPYTVSVVPLVIAVVMVRWGPWSAIHAAAGGILACLLHHAVPVQYAVYCVGNLFPLLLVPALSPRRKDGKIFRNSTGILGYGLAVLLLIQAGRAAVSLVSGGGWQTALACFTTEAVTDLFTLVLLWITGRLDGVLEDQPHYIRRIQAEENA